MRHFSLDPNAEDTPWEDAPLGSVTGDLGYFTIVWPELLHVVEGGVVKKSSECLNAALTHYGTGGYCSDHVASYGVAVLIGFVVRH